MQISPLPLPIPRMSLRKDKIVPLETYNNGKSFSPPMDTGPNVDGSCPSPPPIYHVPYSESGNSTAPAHRKRTMTVDRHGELIRETGLSYLATLLNFLKSLVGAGFLSLPLAFSNAGIWTTLFLIGLFAVLNCICMMQLVKCAQHHYKELGIYFLNYGDMAKITCSRSFKWVRPYSKWAKCIVNMAILFLQFGFCATYYLFIAVSLKEITEELSSFRASLFQWLLIIYIPMVFLNFIRTLRILAFLSTIGNFMMVSSLIFILQYVIRNPKHSISEFPVFNTLDGIFTASGAIIYSFEAQTLVLPMENKLKRPSHMIGPSGVLTVGIFLASLVYSSIGFFGYVAYGNEVKGSITLNLPQNVSFTLVKLAICVSVFGSFLLQMYVIVEMVWSKLSSSIVVMENADEESVTGKGEKMPRPLKSDDDDRSAENASFCPILPAKFKLVGELIFRTLLVTVCFIFAAAVPNLERIIPLVGITSGMLLSFIIPAILDLLTFVPVNLAQGRRIFANCRIVLALLLAFVGLFGMFAGLKASIKDIMADAQKPA